MTICCRKGSKRLPGKNMKPLCGIPLVEHTVKRAVEFKQTKKDDIIIKSPLGNLSRIPNLTKLKKKINQFCNEGANLFGNILMRVME